MTKTGELNNKGKQILLMTDCYTTGSLAWKNWIMMYDEVPPLVSQKQL